MAADVGVAGMAMQLASRHHTEASARAPRLDVAARLGEVGTDAAARPECAMADAAVVLVDELSAVGTSPEAIDRVLALEEALVWVEPRVGVVGAQHGFSRGRVEGRGRARVAGAQQDEERKVA